MIYRHGVKINCNTVKDGIQVFVCVLLECAGGFFLNNGMCERCPANSIKPTAGNNTGCSQCDEGSEMANTQQTACGELFSLVCNESMIKVFLGLILLQIYQVMRTM